MRECVFMFKQFKLMLRTYMYLPLTLNIVPQNGAMSSRDQPLQKGESPLRICSLSKEEFTISKDAKFSPGHTHDKLLD